MAPAVDPPESDKRTYRRVAAGTHVTLRPADVGRRSRRYLEAVAANLSFGGMYLTGPPSFRPGTVLDLEFALSGPDGETHVVRARAIVRWRRRLRHPRGMGVEFVEFDGLGRDRLKVWLERLFGGGVAGA